MLYLAWNSPEVTKHILPALIIHYSTGTHLTEMESELEKMDNYSMMKITKNFPDREFTIDVQVYKALLKVVEMVVPY